MESGHDVIHHGCVVLQGYSFTSEGVSGSYSFGIGCFDKPKLLVGCHKLGFEFWAIFCGCWIISPIEAVDVELSCVCDNFEGDAGDALVGNDVKSGFGGGNAVINFIEQDGDGCLWGTLCRHLLLVDLQHLGFYHDVPVAEVGDDFKFGEFCTPELWVQDIS